MNYKAELEALAIRIEDLIKADIKSKGLVDTGRLLNSVKANVLMKADNAFEIQFVTEDYFKYVDARYNILTDVMNSSQFKAIETDIEDTIAKAYEEELEKIFNKNKHLK